MIESTKNKILIHFQVPEPTKTQFASSPNLSTGLGTVYEDQKNKFKRIDCASTSNLVPRKSPNKDGGMASKLRRISPNFFKSKSLSIKPDKLKPQDSKNSKLNSKIIHLSRIIMLLVFKIM